MDNLMEEIYSKYKRKLSLSNAHKNKLLEVLSSNEFYVAINDDRGEDIINPMIVPLTNRDIAFMIFDNKESVEEYEKINQIEGKLMVKLINSNAFYILIQELFLKGVTGVLLQGNLMGSNRTLYYPILELVNYNSNLNFRKDLYTKDKQDIINCLLYVKNNNKPLSYVYRKDLTASEVALFLVKYHIFDEKNNRNIKFFMTEKLADDFCIKNGFLRNDEPMSTTAHNGILLSSLAKLNDKVDNIYLYTDTKTYKLKILEFLELLVGVGFEQTDLI